MTREELKRHCEATCKMFRNGRTTSRTYMEHRLVLDLLEQAELTSVNEEPKTGHWIGVDQEPHEDWECDNCGHIEYANEDIPDEYHFCPNCGAKMVEPQERLIVVLNKIKGYVDHIRNTGMGKKKSLEFIEKFIEGLKAESEKQDADSD